MYSSKPDNDYQPTLVVDNALYLFKDFMDRALVNQYLCETVSFNTRRVICRIPNVSYDEQIIPEESNLYKFFSSESIISLSKKVLKTTNNLKSILCWTSIYRENEFINLHKDKSGDIQIILCLRNDGINNQGVLSMKVASKSYDFFLAPGDMIYFKATEISHETTPIIANKSNPHPVRMVAVSRQFFT